MFHRIKNDKNKQRQSIRTVSPKVAANSYSYHASRLNRDSDMNRSPEKVQERQQNLSVSSSKQHSKSIFLIILLLIVFGFMTWLNNTPKITILGPTSEQELLQNPIIYRQAIIKLLQSSFTNHNKLTLNTENIANVLEQKFPEISSVSIQAPTIGFSPSIYIIPAIPAILVSNNSALDYVLTESGIAIAAVNNLSKLASLHLPQLTIQSGAVFHVGQAILSNSDITFVQTVMGQLKAHNLIINSLTIPSGTSELDVRISTASYYIKFNLEDNADQQIGTFLAVHKYLVSNNITPTQYIDVRVLGRAFYK